MNTPLSKSEGGKKGIVDGQRPELSAVVSEGDCKAQLLD